MRGSAGSARREEMRLGCRARRFTLLSLAAASPFLGGCPSLRGSGPEDASPVPTPALVSVTIEYRQPNGCLNAAGRCGDAVVFFGTWMRPGAEFPLTPDEGNYIWRGTALGVPVNFPPHGEPYEIRIYDPYLRDTPTEGFTARRLKVGGEAVTRIESPGTQDEHGLVYVDDNGLGRSPY